MTCPKKGTIPELKIVFDEQQLRLLWRTVMADISPVLESIKSQAESAKALVGKLGQIDSVLTAGKAVIENLYEVVKSGGFSEEAKSQIEAEIAPLRAALEDLGVVVDTVSSKAAVISDDDPNVPPPA
jgi:hypothetical protein